MNSIRALLRSLAILLVAGGSSFAEERTFFAFDDDSIPWRDNLKLTMVPAQKHPANPVLRRGPPGAPDDAHAILYGSVLSIGGKFRMWYLAASQPGSDRAASVGNWRPMCYAESTDGVQWTKPDLGLVEFRGSAHNNICLIESEVPSLRLVNDFLSVLYDPDDADPARRYKCAYIAHPPIGDVRGGRSPIGPDEKNWCSFVCATSADGLTWKVVGDRPANSGGERFEVSGLYRFGGFYYASGQLLSPWLFRPDGETIGRAMRIYRSPDFVRWDQTTALGFARPGQLIDQPVVGQQTHMGAGIWNRGNVLVGVYGQWQDPLQAPPKGAKSHLLGTRVDLGLIVSTDGIHWREPAPDFKLIARGQESEWDNIALLQAHAFANVGEQTYLWYSHWDCDGETRNQDIGLATLRRDGFGYLAAQMAAAAAHCETTFFDSRAGDQVLLNIDGVSPDSPVTTELLDEHLNVIRAANTTRSGTRVPVMNLAPQRCALRISLPKNSSARLYAIQVQTASDKANAP